QQTTKNLIMFRLLLHKLCRPCYQVLLFGRTFYLARITNSAYLGTLGCIGFFRLAQFQLN
ncbi:hypothetical protein VB714_16490, partial [Spirulina sp. 06S082]|nr:hypothetical protein [Spirulina sp. 06S082]